MKGKAWQNQHIPHSRGEEKYFVKNSEEHTWSPSCAAKYFRATKNEDFEKTIFRNKPPERVAEVLAHIFHLRTRGRGYFQHRSHS